MNVLSGNLRGTARRASPAPVGSSLTDGGGSLGPWQLTACLHRGKSHDLFRAGPAGDANPGCYVIKTVAAAGDSRHSLAMLRRERITTEAVQHPQLVSLLGAQLTGPQPYLVLPLLEGLPLDKLITRSPDRRLPIATALWIVRQVAEALASLHAAGWLHGQVRPQHVVVAPQGHATLIDLTLARRLNSEECQIAIAPEEPRYAAPEAFSSRSTLSAASDVYCLGLLLFELLTGSHALADSAPAPAAIAEAHRCAIPAKLRCLRPEAPLELEVLLARMLAKLPLRRPGDEQLVRWLTELEIAALDS